MSACAWMQSYDLRGDTDGDGSSIDYGTSPMIAWVGKSPEVRDENGDGWVDLVLYNQSGDTIHFEDQDHDRVFEHREDWTGFMPLSATATYDIDIPAWRFDRSRPPTKEELQRFQTELGRDGQGGD